MPAAARAGTYPDIAVASTAYVVLVLELFGNDAEVALDLESPEALRGLVQHVVNHLPALQPRALVLTQLLPALGIPTPNPSPSLHASGSQLLLP